MYALLFINGDSGNVQVFWLILDLWITWYMYCIYVSAADRIHYKSILTLLS